MLRVCNGGGVVFCSQQHTAHSTAAHSTAAQQYTALCMQQHWRWVRIGRGESCQQFVQKSQHSNPFISLIHSLSLFWREKAKILSRDWKHLSLNSEVWLKAGLKPLAFCGLSSGDGCESKYSLGAFVFQETGESKYSAFSLPILSPSSSIIICP